MKCIFCGKEIDDKSEFCPFCNSRVGYKEEAPVKKEFSDSPVTGKKQVNWVLCLVMSIVFGGIGIDRFIMGHIGLGILKLVTCGGCSIWYIVDIILIATKYKFQDIEWIES